MRLVQRRLFTAVPPALVLLAGAPAALAQGADKADTGGGGVSFFEMFFWSPGNVLGSIMVMFLVLMSCVTVALVILFSLRNRRFEIVPDYAVEEIEQLLEEKQFREAIELAEEEPSVFGEIMHAALSEASNGYGAMERAVEETGDLSLTQRIRSLELLNVFGAVGPMLGLFGTVYGMIVAFYKLKEAGSSVDPQQLAGGISTALVTTLWGLIVGIPAVAAAALIRSRIEALVTEAMAEADAMIGRFRTAGASSKKAPPKPRPTAEQEAEAEEA